MSSKKQTKYAQKFKEDWLKIAAFSSWLSKSRKGAEFAHCKACSSDINISGAGKSDLNRHSATAKHKNKCQSLTGQRTIQQSMPSTSSAVHIKSAELRLVSFQVEHNIPIRTIDHLTQVVKACCPDSKIAQELNLGRTKATAIIKNVIGKTEKEDLCQTMNTQKFSLIADESTDQSATKHLCLVIRLLKEERVTDLFYDLIAIKSSATAVDLYNMIKESFESNGIPWKTNLIGFAADGANVMMGNQHSLKTLLQQDVPQLFTMKCICHSFALCASYACKTLPSNVEDLVREVYNYIQGSPKRIGIYREFQNFLEIKPHKLLHPAQTRWLSLHPVVERVLEQYNALKLYFIDVVTTERLQSPHSILENLNNPFVKLYLEFLSFILPLFNNLNRLMQSESTQIHCLRKNVESVLKTMLGNYMNRDYLQSTPTEQIEYKNSRHFLNLDEIYVGAKVIVGLQNVNNPEHIKSFRLKILEFYIEAVHQIYSRFSFSNTVFQQLEIIDPAVVKAKKYSTIAPVAATFPNLVEESQIQILDNEWRLLQNTCDLEYELSPEIFWVQVSKKRFGSDTSAFPVLTNFIRNLLCLPHSSACVERIFSTVNLNKTKQRNRLGTKTLCGVLHTKKAFSDKQFCYNHTLNRYLPKFNNAMYHEDSDSD